LAAEEFWIEKYPTFPGAVGSCIADGEKRNRLENRERDQQKRRKEKKRDKRNHCFCTKRKG